MNTPHIDDAAAALAAALNAAKAKKPSSDEVSLTMIQGVPEFIWKMLHPQGLDGKFVKKGTGVYLYGHAKSAFSKNDAGADVAINLDPGDKLVQTKSGVKAVIHPDGSAQVFSSKTGTLGVAMQPPSGKSSWLDNPAFSGHTVLDESKALEVNAPDDNIDVATAEVKAKLAEQAKGTFDEVKTDATQTPTPDVPAQPAAAPSTPAKTAEVPTPANTPDKTVEAPAQAPTPTPEAPKAVDTPAPTPAHVDTAPAIKIIPAEVTHKLQDKVYQSSETGDYAVVTPDGTGDYYYTSPATGNYVKEDLLSHTVDNINTEKQVWNLVKDSVAAPTPDTNVADTPSPDAPQDNTPVDVAQVDNPAAASKADGIIDSNGNLIPFAVPSAVPHSPSDYVYAKKSLVHPGIAYAVVKNDLSAATYITPDSKLAVLSTKGLKLGADVAKNIHGGSTGYFLIKKPENVNAGIADNTTAPTPDPAQSDAPYSNVPDSSSDVIPASDLPKPSATSSAVAGDAGKAVTSTKAGPPYGPSVWITPDWIDPSSGKPYLMSSQGETNLYSVFSGDAKPAMVTNSKGQEFNGLDPASLLYTGANKKTAKTWIAEMNDLSDTKATAAPVPDALVNAAKADDAVLAATPNVEYPKPPSLPSDANLPTKSTAVPGSIASIGQHFWKNSSDNSLLSYNAAADKWTYYTKTNAGDWSTLDSAGVWKEQAITPAEVSSIISGSDPVWSKIQQGDSKAKVSYGSGWEGFNSTAAGSPKAPKVPDLIPGVSTNGKDVYQTVTGLFTMTYDPITNKWQGYFDDKSLGKHTPYEPPPVDIAKALDSKNLQWEKLQSASGDAPTPDKSLIPDNFTLDTAGKDVWKMNGTEGPIVVAHDPATNDWTYYSNGSPDGHKAGNYTVKTITEGTGNWDKIHDAPAVDTAPAHSSLVMDAATAPANSIKTVWDVNGVPVVQDHIKNEWKQFNPNTNTYEPATISQYLATVNEPNPAHVTDLPSEILDPNNKVYFSGGTYMTVGPNNSTGLKHWKTLDGKWVKTPITAKEMSQAGTFLSSFQQIHGINDNTLVDFVNDLPIPDALANEDGSIYKSLEASSDTAVFVTVSPDGSSAVGHFYNPVTGSIDSSVTYSSGASFDHPAVWTKVKEPTPAAPDTTVNPDSTPDAPSVDTPAVLDTPPSVPAEADDKPSPVKFTKNYVDDSGAIHWTVLDLKSPTGDAYAVVSKGGTYEVFSDASENQSLGVFKKAKEAKDWLSKNHGGVTPTAAPVTTPEETPVDVPAVPESSLPKSKPLTVEFNTSDFSYTPDKTSADIKSALVLKTVNQGISSYGLDANGLVIASPNQHHLALYADELIAKVGPLKKQYATGDDLTVVDTTSTSDFTSNWKAPTSITAKDAIVFGEGFSAADAVGYAQLSLPSTGPLYDMAFNAKGDIIAYSGATNSWLGKPVTDLYQAVSTSNFDFAWATPDNFTPKELNTKQNLKSDEPFWLSGIDFITKSPEDYFTADHKFSLPSSAAYLVRFVGSPVYHGVNLDGYIVGSLGEPNLAGDSIQKDHKDKSLVYFGKIDPANLEAPTPYVDSHDVPAETLSPEDASALNKDTGSGVKVSPLSTDAEEPTMANPTPGDPKAYLDVPVVGLGDDKPGSYFTKKLKDKDGKPYFITSNGKPNNWEVYDNEGYKALTWNKETSTWDGNAQPLHTAKQLKKAKGWLAGDKANTGATSNVGISSANGLSIVEFDGKKIYLPYNHTAYLSPSEEVLNVWGELGNVTSHQKGAEFPVNLGDVSSTQFKKDGWKFIGSPEINTDGYLAEALSNANINDAINDPSSVSDLTNPYDLESYVGQHSYQYIPYSISDSDTIDTVSKSEWFSDYASNFYTWMKSNNTKAFLAKAQEIWSSSSGPEKSRARRALNRAQRDLIVMNIFDKVKNEQTLTENDLAILHNYTLNPPKGTMGSDSINSLTNALYRIARKDAFAKRASDLGFEVGYTDVKLYNEHISLSAEDILKARKFAGELGFKHAGHLSDEQAQRYLYNVISGQAIQNANMEKPLAAKAAVQTAIAEYKTWKAEHSGTKSSPQPVTNASSANIGVLGEIVSGNSFTVPKYESLSSPDGSKYYTYNGFTDSFDASDGSSSLTSKSANMMAKMGLLLPSSSDGSVDPGVPFKYSNVTKYFGDDALWVPNSAQTAQLAFDGKSSAAKVANPLLLSLLDVSNNPYAHLKDFADPAWVELAKNVQSKAPEYWDSNGDTGNSWNTLLDAFYLVNDSDVLVSVSQMASAKQWLKNDVLPFLKDKAPNLGTASGLDLSSIKDTNAKVNFPNNPDPTTYDPQVWDLVKDISDGYNPPFLDDVVVTDYQKNLIKNKMQSVDPFIDTADLPPALSKLLPFYKNAYGAYGDVGSPGQSHILAVLAKVANSGVWSGKVDQVTVEVPTELQSDLHGVTKGKTSLNLKMLPGSAVYAASPYSYMSLDEAQGYNKKLFILSADQKTGYQVSYGYDSTDPSYSVLTADTLSSYLQNSNALKPFFWSDLTLDHAFFAKHNPNASAAEVDLLLGAKNADYADVQVPGFSSTNYGDTLVALKKAIKADPTKYELLDQNFSNLSQGMLKTLHYGVKTGNDNFLDLLKTLKKFGQIQPKQESTDSSLPHPNINKNSLYYHHILKGETSFDQIDQVWTVDESIEAAKDLLGVDGTTYTNNMYSHDQQIADLLNSKLPQSTVKQNNAHPSVMTLHKIEGTALGGMHTKQQWADDNGEVWMSKAFSSDPNSKARIDAEHYSMRIAELYGWNPPATFAMKTPDGQYAYVQHLAPASGSLKNKGWKDVPENVLHQAMSQHVLDWVISNHDSHAENIMVTEDGNSAFPIDRGQAFKHFPKDKLAVGYLPQGNFAPVWYDSVYYAIQNKEMSKEQVDALRDYVLRKAAIVTTRDDESYQKYVSAALAGRTNFPSALPSADAMVGALMKRKAATFDDFQKLWQGIYAKAGYDYQTPKTIEEYLPKKIGKAHTSVTPDFAEDVAKANSIGVPVFFAGDEWDNGHVQVYTTQAPDGKTTLRMFGKLRAGAEKILSDWLSKQTIDKVAHSAASSSYTYEEPKPSHSALPGIAQAHQAVVAYVTTVGSHIKKGDYEYNTSTLNNAEQWKTKLQKEYDAVSQWDQSNVSVYDKAVFGENFVTSEQQDAWLKAASETLENFALVDKAVETKVSVTKTNPDKVPFNQPSYTPSPGIDTSGKPKATEAWVLEDGSGIEKWSDGKYVKTTADGNQSKISKDEYNTLSLQGQPAAIDTPTEEAATPDGESVTVSAGTQIVKVTHRAAQFPKGEMDYNTGVVTDVPTGKVAKGVNGSEYLIEFDDIKIQFQHSNDVTASSQKGLMRVTISDWQKGGTQQIENTLSTLRSMGLDLTPADEQELELLYWRQMYGTLQNRKLDTAFSKVKKTLDKADLSALGAGDEIAAYRSAFGEVYGPSRLTEFIEKGGHLPQLSRHVASGGADGVYSGRPYWLHPDVMDMEKIKNAAGGKVLTHDISYGAQIGVDAATSNIVKGGFHATEERLRVLGTWVDGMSSIQDQGKGSSQYMFTRSGNSPSSWNISFDPMTFLRVSNYILSGDQFGNSNSKPQSPFNQTDFASVNGFNEAMIKNGGSLMSDFTSIVVPNATVRKQLIDFYHSMGVKEIRGLPVEKRIVINGSDAQQAITATWDKIIADQKKGIMPWDMV